MMKKVFLILILSIDSFCIKSYSQTIEDWELQPTTTSEFLWGIYFVDSLKGWAAGDGTVLHTDNGGQTWNEQNIYTGGYYLWGINFPDSIHGWIVGENYPNGVIYYTANGGNNWSIQYSTNQWVLFELFFLDNQNGWVVGGDDFPVILNTNNGGITWNVQYANPEISKLCQDISFCNDSTGWAVGSEGLILHTNDGGNNWTSQDFTTYGYIRNVQAMSNSLAFSCGTTGLFLYTHDGGNNWQQISTSTFDQNNLQGLYFLDSLNGWIVGDLGSLYYTINGGMNWTHEDFGFYEFFHDIYFTDQSNGWIAGMDGLIYHTSNGGGLITQQNEYLEDNFDSEIFITPNPSQDYFEIIFNLDRIEKIQIGLFNFEGKLIQKIQDQQFYVGHNKVYSEILKNQPNGIYLLNFQINSKNKTEKIIHLN